MADVDPAGLERRRGRPSPERAAAIEGLIRAAGLEVFLEAGYEAANMDVVAARAGISKATLYTRFDSKEALFRAVLADQNKLVSQQTAQGLQQLPPDFELRLRFHARAILDSFRSEHFRRLDRLVTSAKGSFPDMTGLMQGFVKTDHGKLLAQSLAEAARCEGLAAMDWGFVSSLLINGISGWYLNESEFRTLSQAEGDDFCGKLVEMILTAARVRA